ncbi:hypothetical protein BS17DRAFT_773573 [Gyrodon lividus]|nr:hypothetical protein BS17DRAFT_773573 [Gyrodon lividus]
MSHLLFWPAKTFFYPIGNTSAVCLTENLPPEQKADILLLACGDPRHILYTVYTNETNLSTKPQNLDITCCDIEAGVLARNALLFTLLADDGVEDKLNSIWNIFYHLLLDQTSLTLLLAQCRKLVGLAKDTDSWRAGPYSHFLTTCDAATLAELRRFWNMYVETADYTPQQVKQFKSNFLNGMREVSQRHALTMTSSRSAGPLAVFALQAVVDQFNSFWSSGLTDDGSQSGGKATSVNPTFAFSMARDKFAVHYGTDPVGGFHLAVPCSSESSTLRDGVVPHNMVCAAKNQFSQWCTSVMKLLKSSSASSPSLILRMFAGDALMFCQVLHYCGVSQSIVTPFDVAAWRSSKIELDGHHYGKSPRSPAPTYFNVIDSSNVLDHIGLVNVLVVTTPLLRRTPSAALYTEALLKKGDNPSKAILEHVCGEISTMSLLLGIVPSTFISRFTTRSNVNESIDLALGQDLGGQYHERLAWKAIGTYVVGFTDAQQQFLSFSPDELAAFLFGVYLKMFSDENMANKFAALSLSPAPALRAFRRSGVLHYTRRSFAQFVHLVKTRIRTDWTKAMRTFEDMVQRDSRLFIGMLYYQELCCHLHLLGVFTSDWMTPHKVREIHGDKKPALFRDWTEIPQVINVVLVVPRINITRLEEEFSEVGTPIFQCDILAVYRQNCFASISGSFGTLEVVGKGENKTGLIVEDQAGRFGESSLIVSFSVPSSSVMLSALDSAATAGLTLRGTPAVSAKFFGKLGPNLSMFRAQLMDTKHVHVLAQPPTSSTASQRDTTPPMKPVLPDVIPEKITRAQMNESCTTVKSFTVRKDITDPIAKASLASGVAVTIGQVSMHEACVRIGTCEHVIDFPLPVDVGNAKLRIARNSSYVEVIAPISPSVDIKGECDVSKRFSAFLEGGSPTLGSIHRVNLGRCPPFKLSKHPKALNWFVPHVSLMFSQRERAQLEIQNKSGASIADTLMNIKDSLHTLLLSAAGVQGNPPQSVFTLLNTSKMEHYLCIFVANLRLDVASHTVIADAFIAPRTPAVRDKLFSLGLDLRVVNIKTDADESKAWRYLLPLLTERCRTWTHKPTCEYLSHNSIPPFPEGPDPEKSPFCSCGRGVGTEALPKRFKGVGPYVTRAAISPLFSVPYLEASAPEKYDLTAVARAKCQLCGKEGGLSVCSRCKIVKYCSRECQVKDWKEHKKGCV